MNSNKNFLANNGDIDEGVKLIRLSLIGLLIAGSKIICLQQ